MKTFSILIFSLLFIKNAWSFTITKKAVIRDQHFKAKIAEVELEDLTTEDAFEGKYFKIVKGKNNSPVSFKDSEDIQLRAATTYYHLMRARYFFINQMKSAYVESIPQMTIRIELTNVFNEIGHFANDNLDPQFNNALSVPAGVGYPKHGIEPWGMEIWFRPSKDINIEDFGGGDFVSIKSALASYRNEAQMENLNRFIAILISGGSRSSIEAGLIRVVETSILMEIIYQGSDKMADFFSRKIYHLDTALVPEIIYHEFSHIALSENLELSHSTPVNEGLADYFAGKIANSKSLATKIKDYNLFDGKKVRNKVQYNAAFERSDMANSDFVFGLLWNVGTLMDPLQKSGNHEGSFVYQMAKKLNTEDSIREGLIKASLDECTKNCQSPMSDKIKLYEFYHSKNI